MGAENAYYHLQLSVVVSDSTGILTYPTRLSGTIISIEARHDTTILVPHPSLAQRGKTEKNERQNRHTRIIGKKRQGTTLDALSMSLET
jgi:hypothetical protein